MNPSRREKIGLHEPVSKGPILFKVKKGENFNHRPTWRISRIEPMLHFVQNVEPDPRGIGPRFHGAGADIGQRGPF